MSEHDKRTSEVLYNDQAKHLKTHDNILNSHHDLLKEHGRKIEDLESEFGEMKPIVTANRDANVEQNIIMANINDTVNKLYDSMENSRKDSKGVFRWLIMGFVAVIGTMGGFIVWMLQTLISMKAGGI